MHFFSAPSAATGIRATRTELAVALAAVVTVLTLVVTLVIPAGRPAGAAGDQLGPSGIQLHDTIWELPLRATVAEADTYFAYLASKGYDGAWMSLFSGPAANTFATNRNGNVLASIDGNGDFQLDAAYIADTRAILDRATAHGIEVYMVAIWGVAYIHDNTNGFCSGLNSGPLNAGNAEHLGEQIAAGFADHPAIVSWVYGGDNWCPPGLAAEDVNIWRNLDVGMIAGGATQPVGYHSPNGADLRFKDEPWNDYHAMQTAHCTVDGELDARFQAAIAGSTKPVWAAEMRYEGIEPTFCTPTQVANGAPSPGNPVTAQQVLSDSTAAFNAGVAGIVYGHNERWQWSAGVHGSSGTGWTGVMDSFNAPGEDLTIALFGAATPECNGMAVTVDLNNGDSPTTGDDVILGTPGADLIDGLAGADVICAEGGDDVVNGGPGADIIFGGPGGDQLFGDGENDTIEGGDDPDYIDGGDGEDNLSGDDGDDQLYGRMGADTLIGGLGFDQLFGFEGNDDLHGDVFGDPVPGEADYLWGGPGIDSFRGGAGDDWFEGDDEAEQMVGDAGNDIMLGHGGDDTLIGGAGLDYLWGGPGVDSYDGGDDRDTLDGNDGGEDAGETMDGGAGDDIIVGWGGADSLIGGPGSDYLWGSTGIDSYDGGDGPDYLDGNDDGEDAGEVMSGGLGDDQVIGWGGDDTLNGGADNDYLWGGEGTDQLNGDDGALDLCVDPQGASFDASCEFTALS